jgi:hypothetical protein
MAGTVLMPRWIHTVVVEVTTIFAVEEFFFLRVALRKKGRKIDYRRDIYKIRRRVFFCPTSRTSQESEGFLFRRATYKGTYEEAFESARAGLSPKKGDVRKKRRRPRKVVCRHKKGTWERREEKDQGRREGGSREGKVPCALNPDFLFLVHENLGLEAARLVWSISSYKTWYTRKPYAKEVPETCDLTRRKQYLKRTTLHRLKIPLRSIRSEEGPNYRLGAKR